MSAQSQQSSPRGNGTPTQVSRSSGRGKVFYGSSKISDYEVLKKLGEGTFGYGSMRVREEVFTEVRTVRFIEQEERLRAKL